jgi:hypothetical protein
MGKQLNSKYFWVPNVQMLIAWVAYRGLYKERAAQIILKKPTSL